MLPDAAVRNGVEGLLKGPAARRAVLVSSAPEPGSTPALREFEAAFERTYGRRPGRYAALGHAAMETVLGALGQAAAEDRAGERRRVLQQFFSGRPREHRRRTAARASLRRARAAAVHRLPRLPKRGRA